MNVKLKIEEDEELRLAIKDAIKGQVLSITRDEITSMLKLELERKLKGLDTNSFNNFLREAIKQLVKDELYKHYDIGKWGIDYIKPFIVSIISDLLKDKDWNKIVDTLAKEKLKQLIETKL